MMWILKGWRGLGFGGLGFGGLIEFRGFGRLVSLFLQYGFFLEGLGLGVES